MAYPNQYGYGQSGYPTYLPQQNYNAQQYSPQMGGMQQMSQPQPQAAPIIWVQGEAGAKSFLVAPGQTVQLMDSESEVFYIKATDQSGMPLPLRIFDYKERIQGVQRPVQAAQMQTEQYVTRMEYDALAAKLAEMAAKLEAIYAAPAPRVPDMTEGQRQPQRMRRGLREEGISDE